MSPPITTTSGNDLAKLGKVDDARAAYQKYVDLNPTDAALAWRNFGTVLYHANRMKEAIEPLQKATTLDPKNAPAWLLLGIAMVNTMEFKTEGDKITPVMQPGTIEAYQRRSTSIRTGPLAHRPSKVWNPCRRWASASPRSSDRRLRRRPRRSNNSLLLTARWGWNFLPPSAFFFLFQN